MSVAEDLGNLIIKMNPYIHGPLDSMDPHMFVDAFDIHTSPPSSPPSPPDPRQVWMEMDTRYPGEWTFKGQPHRINTALRIAYRWARRKDGIWITDYLMIGYEGSNGGG